MNYITKLEQAVCSQCIWNDPLRDGDQCRHATGLIYERNSWCSHGRWIWDNGPEFPSNDIPQGLIEIYQLLRLKDRKEKEREAKGGNTD